MTDRERDLEEILARLEKQRPEIDRILSRPTVMDTKRPAKKLCRIPPDMDFTVKDGNTEYEVAGMFQRGHRKRSARFCFLCFSPISTTSFANCS